MQKSNALSNAKKFFFVLSFVAVINALVYHLSLMLVEVSNIVNTLLGFYDTFDIHHNGEMVVGYIFIASLFMICASLVYLIFYRRVISLPIKIALLISGAVNTPLIFELANAKSMVELHSGSYIIYVIIFWLLVAITAAEIIMLMREVVVNLGDMKSGARGLENDRRKDKKHCR